MTGCFGTTGLVEVDGGWAGGVGRGEGGRSSTPEGLSCGLNSNGFETSGGDVAGKPGMSEGGA